MTLENQIIFEIAMGVGNDLDLTVMLKKSLSIYLRRLNCTSGAVLERRGDREAVTLAPVFSIPRNAFERMARTAELAWTRETMELRACEKRVKTLPEKIATPAGRTLFLFALEDFGLLILEKTDGNLSEKLIRSLLPVNEKLARACLLCRQTDLISQKNQELEREIGQRIAAEEARRLMEHQIIQAQKLESLGVLAGGIAHDFNNLLMGILCNADIAMMDIREGSEAAACVETIKRISKQASGLCDQILLYSGKASLREEPVAMRQLIEEMTDLIDTSISKKVRIRYHFDPHLPQISGDSTQLRQVILNLLINSSEAIGGELGFIDVSLSVEDLDPASERRFYFDKEYEAGRYFCLTVADSGCGMDDQTRNRIFEPFFTTKFSGRGLGLAAVLGAVHSHRGLIDVQSTPGEGTEFNIYFPVIPMVGTVALDVEKTASREMAGKRALVVDDEYVIASLVARMLQLMGFEALIFTDPRKALEEVLRKTGGFDLAVIDMKMPEMDGVDLFHAIRLQLPDIRGILTSGYYETELDDSCKNSGFSAFLHKPYEFKSLQKTIRTVMAE